MDEYRLTPRDQVLESKWDRDQARVDKLSHAKTDAKKKAGKAGRKKHHRGKFALVTIRRIQD